MERKRIDGYKYNAHYDAEKDIDKRNDEFFRIRPHFGEDRKGFAATLVFEFAKGQRHGMLKPFGKDSCPEFLDDDIAAVVLEGFCDPRDHRHPDEDAEIADNTPGKLVLVATPCGMKDLFRIVITLFKRVNCKNVQH